MFHAGPEIGGPHVNQIHAPSEAGRDRSASTSRLMLITSDSHVAPRMEEFRPFIELEYLDDFDAFLVAYREVGSRNFEARALRHRLDPEEIERWETGVVEAGFLEGASDLKARREFMARDGVAGEVVFPISVARSSLYGSPSQAAYLEKEASPDHLAAGNRAYNRWLTHFVEEAGSLSAAMAPSNRWIDVAVVISELETFRDAGFRGIVLPSFGSEHPPLHPDHDPIWSAIEALDLVVACHGPASLTTTAPLRTPGAPAPGRGLRHHEPGVQVLQP